MTRLAEVARFAWVLPGHGRRGHAEPEEMTCQLNRLADEMGAHTARTWDRR
jgi:hypothetical protein